jgi:hypothetical protein
VAILTSQQQQQKNIMLQQPPPTHQEQQQQQQLLLSTFRSWMFLTTTFGNHSKLSTLGLWLPVSMMFFSYFGSKITSISFVYSFLLSSF